MNTICYAFLKNIERDQNGNPKRKKVVAPGNPQYGKGIMVVRNIKYIWNYLSDAEVWEVSTKEEELICLHDDIYCAKECRLINKAKESAIYETICQEIMDEKIRIR